MDEFNRFGRIVSDLQKEVSLYEDLFGNTAATKVLNQLSPDVFSIIQTAMFFEIISRLAALFDPALTGKGSNLSIHHLVGRVDGRISTKSQTLLKDATALYKETGIKSFRNKALAHIDLKQYLGEAQVATNISYDNVSDILSKLEILIRNMPVEAGILASGHVIYRDSNLPKLNNGKALLSKLEVEHNKHG